MLVGDFKAKQEYKTAQTAVAVLLATDRGEDVAVKHLNEAYAILWPHLSVELQGSLILR